MIWMRAAALAGMTALAACATVHETTLPNGLKVIVQPDRRAPVAVAQLWYRVGGSDEPDGLTGISHALEHMMFKGTSRLKPGEFSRIIAEHGGRENAFTGKDYTAYHQQLERSRLGVAFELEADRMRGLTLDAQEFAKEIRVVMEERRLRTEDRPQALLYERFTAEAYREHPYRNPIVGWMKDLEALTVEDLRAWYRSWYAPNNAILVVVGDVEAQAVFALAQKYYGAIPPASLADRRRPRAPAQQELRRVRVAAPAEVPSLLLGFHAPSLTDYRAPWEPYALEVLAGVLDGGRSARFARALVRERQIASSIDVDYSPAARYATLFQVSATPAQGKGVAELEQAILGEIARLQREPVSDAELERVKAQVVASNVFGRDSTFYQALQIGMLEAVGLDRRLIDRYVEAIRAVTAAQVQETARRYLVETNLTVAVLDPQPLSGRRPGVPPVPLDNHAH